MRIKKAFPKELSQNKGLPIRIVSPGFGHLAPEAAEKHVSAQQLPYYFFLLILEGSATYDVDLKTYDVSINEMAFFLPHQIQQYPSSFSSDSYYKLGFDEECLSRLPKKYPFLLNPLNNQKICFTPEASKRLQFIFEILLGLLKSPDTNVDLILAHVNSLMTEINTAYFSELKKPADGKLEKFIGFKVFIENKFTDHPTIKDIAEKLAVSTDSLYEIVKHYSGLSPKEYLTERIIEEARRRIYYGEKTTVKELAFELGFNDPDYFSRLFKKVTGKTIARFFQDLS